jgi:hypothetical protein
MGAASDILQEVVLFHSAGTTIEGFQGLGHLHWKKTYSSKSVKDTHLVFDWTTNK